MLIFGNAMTTMPQASLSRSPGKEFSHVNEPIEMVEHVTKVIVVSGKWVFIEKSVQPVNSAKEKQ
jgi:hypothetical protein